MRLGSADVVLAAGALVWRERGGQLEVLAVHRPRYDDWSWPKGKLDPGETLPECAIREVAEETGEVIALGVPLPTLTYSLGGGKSKVVWYWAAQAIEAESPAVLARNKVKPAPKHEIDQIVWLDVDQARHLITFPDDLKPLEQLVLDYEAGTLNTRPFVVARHARARRRRAWNGSDVRRPLTTGGAKRAEQLRGLFAAFGVDRLSSSTALRCVQTINPYAAVAGLTVRGYTSLTEETYRSRPAKTQARFADLLGKPRARAVCVHRPTLPALMTVLKQRVTPQTRGKLPRTMPYLPAGGVLIAHVVDGEQGPRIVAIETHGLKPTW